MQILKYRYSKGTDTHYSSKCCYSPPLPGSNAVFQAKTRNIAFALRDALGSTSKVLSFSRIWGFFIGWSHGWLTCIRPAGVLLPAHRLKGHSRYMPTLEIKPPGHNYRRVPQMPALPRVSCSPQRRPLKERTTLACGKNVIVWENAKLRRVRTVLEMVSLI